MTFLQLSEPISGNTTLPHKSVDFNKELLNLNDTLEKNDSINTKAFFTNQSDIDYSKLMKPNEVFLSNLILMQQSCSAVIMIVIVEIVAQQKKDYLRLVTVSKGNLNSIKMTIHLTLLIILLLRNPLPGIPSQINPYII